MLPMLLFIIMRFHLNHVSLVLYWAAQYLTKPNSWTKLWQCYLQSHTFVFEIMWVSSWDPHSTPPGDCWKLVLMLSLECSILPLFIATWQKIMRYLSSFKSENKNPFSLVRNISELCDMIQIVFVLRVKSTYSHIKKAKTAFFPS